jgi:hypothetical protein
MVIELKEYCICNRKKVDVEKCLDYMQQRAELEKRLKHADYHEERKRIQQELSNTPTQPLESALGTSLMNVWLG